MNYSLAALFAGTAALALGSAAAAAPLAASRWIEGPCLMPAPGVPMRCGQVVVPERRDGRGVRDISLNVQIVLAGREPKKDDPIILLGGGPGEILTDKAARVALRATLRDRDVVLLDQRGVGRSSPSLLCETVATDERIEGFLSRMERDKRLKTCIASYDGKADIGAYTTEENAADVIDVVRALGYRDWNILGVSYGTRLGLAVMRKQPEGLRAVVLDSPYPPEVNGFDEKPVVFFRQLDRLLADCATDAACAKAYPDLKARVTARFESLAATPVRAEVVGQRGGAPAMATISARLVLGDLRRAMYSHGALPRVPLALDRLAKQDYAGYFAALDGPRPTTPPPPPPAGFFSQGMQLSIQCNDEQGWRAPEAKPPLNWPKAVVGAFEYPYGRADCRVWKVPSAPQALHAPVVSDLPVLVLAGEYDPVTSPQLGEAALPYLKNGRLAIIPGHGHTLNSTPCGAALVGQFISDPKQPLDDRCVAETKAAFRFATPAE